MCVCVCLCACRRINKNQLFYTFHKTGYILPVQNTFKLRYFMYLLWYKIDQFKMYPILYFSVKHTHFWLTLLYILTIMSVIKLMLLHLLLVSYSINTNFAYCNRIVASVLNLCIFLTSNETFNTYILEIIPKDSYQISNE